MVLGLAGAATIFLHTPFVSWVRIAGSLLVLAVTLRQLASARSQRVVLTHDTSQGWLLERNTHEMPVSGQLVKAGYRSAQLLVVVLQCETGRLHRQALWQDQLSGRQFSYLQQHMLFACEAPTRTSLKVRLVTPFITRPWTVTDRHNRS